LSDRDGADGANSQRHPENPKLNSKPANNEKIPRIIPSANQIHVSSAITLFFGTTTIPSRI
jgi:hypothetical protein